jgi:plasmid stabilization system protein ParE
MARVTWTPKALADLDRLEAFLAKNNPRSAARAILTIIDSIEILKTFPEIGRTSPDLDPDQGDLLVPFSSSGYVVGYGVFGDDVEIFNVRHMREDDISSEPPPHP